MIPRRDLIAATSVGGIAFMATACSAATPLSVPSEISAENQSARLKSVQAFIADYNRGKRDTDMLRHVDLLCYTHGAAETISAKPLIDLSNRSIFRLIGRNAAEISLVTVSFDNANSVSSIGLF